MREIGRIVVVGILASSVASGCGGEPASSSSSLKPPDASQLDQMKNSMTTKLKSKNYVDRSVK